MPDAKVTSGNNEVIKILEVDESLTYILQVALELSLHRHTSSYALLGFEYVPVKGTNSLMVCIKYSNKNEINYLSKIRSITSCKYIYRGLDKQFLPAITDSIIDFGKEIRLPAGYLKFDIAANCEIGSSPLIFGIMTKMLLTTLLNINMDRLMEDGYFETLFTNIILHSEIFKK